jgi:hypothetical protein
MSIELSSTWNQVVITAQKYFHAITSFPPDIRPDQKLRTGLFVFLREPEPPEGRRNQISIPIFRPSEDAKIFAVEKAVRSWTLGDYSSQNSADPTKLRFPGCITVEINRQIVQVSCSGLDSPEDVGGSVIILAKLFKVKPKEICDNVQVHGGQLPEEFLDKYSYLNWLIKKPDLDVSIYNKAHNRLPV